MIGGSFSTKHRWHSKTRSRTPAMTIIAADRNRPSHHEQQPRAASSCFPVSAPLTVGGSIWMKMIAYPVRGPDPRVATLLVLLTQSSSPLFGASLLSSGTIAIVTTSARNERRQRAMLPGAIPPFPGLQTGAHPANPACSIRRVASSTRDKKSQPRSWLSRLRSPPTLPQPVAVPPPHLQTRSHC